MAANNQGQDEQGLSARCIILLEEVKGLLENQSPYSSSENSVNEGASTSSQSKMTDERNRSVRSDINQPSTSSAPSTSRHAGQDCDRSSRALQNFRSLFSSYGSSRKSWVGPPLAKKAKKGPFQVKETWTHEFYCLSKANADRVPSRLEKIHLQNAGLGRKKVVFKCNASALELRTVLESVYPKLCGAGGFELLRSGHPCTALVLITPPATGYSVPFLRDSAGLGQALAYIRPLQKDIDLSVEVVEELQVCYYLNNLYIDLYSYTRALNCF